MPAPRERRREAVERLLERERPAVVAVAIEPPARRVERRLRVEPAVDHVRHDLQMALRLHVPAHHAERAEQRAVAQQQARDDRVVRALAGREPVRVARLEREAGAAVLQHDARAGCDDHEPKP